MKTVAAVALAAITMAFVAVPTIASEPAGGHYEWRHVPRPGPNKSNLPDSQRVWVPDNAAMADCHCDMMKMSAADCMTTMPGMRKSPSAG